MDDMTTMLQHPTDLGFDRTSLLCGLGGACAVGLFHLYRWSMSQRNWRDGEEYGSARWSTSREMAPYTDSDTRQNLQMTATEGLSVDTQATRRNINTTVIGGSGSGKTATHVIPNILKGSMNYACTDPKGELYAKTGGRLEKMGYTVKQLDLVDLTSETKFNPMRYIDPTKPDVAIMRLVTNIMDNTNGSTPKEHQTDDFWTKSERSLLTALTAFVYYLPDDILKDCLHIDAGQTLNAVADMRDLLEASEQDETKESQVDAVARTATEIYEETRAEWERAGADHDDPDLREAWRLAQGLKFAARQYRPFTQGAGETKKGIIISLGVRLAPLTVGPVREILSDDNLGIDRIGGYQDEGGYRHPNKKTAIFLALPDEDPTFNFLAAIFYQCLFDSIIRRCRAYPGECLATPLHCFLDEFANVGRIPNFDKLVATIRSRKVSVSIILQTIAQLKTMYKDSWETIVGNCDSVLFLGGNEQSTTEWLSKLLGKETIDLRTTSDSKGVSGSHTINYQRTGRELLTPDELAQLDNDKCIYNLRGLHPFLSRQGMAGNDHRQAEIHTQALRRMEGSGMKPGSGKDSTYVLEVDKWKFIVFTDLDRMDLTSFVSIAPGIAVRSDYCIRAMEDRTGKYDIRLHMGYSEEEQRIVLRNCEIGTTRELKIRDIARLPIEQIIRAYHPPLWSYEITDGGTNIFGPLPDWEHDALSSVDFSALRKQGPTPDTLKWASRVYSVAQLNKGPATKRLAEVFGIPLRTASHWLTLMKERVPESVSMKLPTPITVLDCQNV